MSCVLSGFVRPSSAEAIKGTKESIAGKGRIWLVPKPKKEEKLILPEVPKALSRSNSVPSAPSILSHVSAHSAKKSDDGHSALKKKMAKTRFLRDIRFSTNTSLCVCVEVPVPVDFQVAPPPSDHQMRDVERKLKEIKARLKKPPPAFVDPWKSKYTEDTPFTSESRANFTASSVALAFRENQRFRTRSVS